MNAFKTTTRLSAAALSLSWVAAALGAANITPYQPTGWSDKIVVATTTGTTNDSPALTTGDTLYVDWALVNNGDAAAGGFYSALYVDGGLKNYWYTSALNANSYFPVNDYSLGSLSAGSHTLTITNDVFGTVAESNEADNAYTKTIVVNPPSAPNLAPYQPAGWSDKIVVSTTTGTTADSPLLTTADTLYVDWAVINNGTAAAASRFYTALYVDSVLRISWYTDPPLATNSYTWAADYSIGSLSAGYHSLRLTTDSTGMIVESDELDNTYTRTIVISPPSQPNLAPYQAPGWSDKVVVATNSGTRVDTPSPTTADALFVSWAVVNNGSAAVTNGFLTTLSVDGTLRNTWSNAPSLNASGYVSATDYVIGSLSAGLHTVTLETDTGSAVAESNEGDNSYIKLVAVLQAPPAVQTQAATAISDVSAQLHALVQPNGGNGYAWFEYGTNSSYGSTTPLQVTGVVATNISSVVSALTGLTTYHYRGVAYNAGGTNRGGDISFTTLGPEIRIEPLVLTFVGTASPSTGVSLEVASPQPSASAAEPVALAPDQKFLDPLRLTSSFTNSPTVKVTVNLSLPLRQGPKTDFASSASLKTHQANVKQVQDEVLENLPAGEAKVRFRFENLAGFSAEVTPLGLRALANDPRVVSIEPVFEVQAHLAQGIPLMHAMTYRSCYNGAGMAIAICDTGIDYRHPRLGGGGFPNSKVLGGYDFGDNDADPLPNTQGHGTCCAGVVAGALGTVGDYIGGVAFNGKLYAVKISPGTTGGSSTDAMVAAWDWCVTHRNDNPNYPLLVMSTSFGGGRYFSPCDGQTPSMTTAANNAVAAGITVLASSGNDGYCNSMAWPACISNVISVGAVYDASFGHYYPCVNSNTCAPKIAGGCATGYYADDFTAADKVTSYSNMATNVTLLAPANMCYTSDIIGTDGESSGDYYDSFGGTSAACPYAAGAVACLQAAAKARTGAYLSPAAVRSLLVSSGDGVTDTKVAITKPRVNLQRAIESLPDFSQRFRVYNDGAGTLAVSSIIAESAAPWISLTPAVPFEVPAGGYQDVSVVVDLAQAPAGQTSVRLLVASNDPDKSPYPGGVYVQTIRQIAPLLSGMALSNGGFRFSVSGPATSNCVVQISTNLANWWPLCTNLIPTGGALQVTDTGVTNQSWRFYRALIP